MTVMETDSQQNTPAFDPLAWLSQQTGRVANNTQPVTTPDHQPTASQPLSHAEELAKARAVARELVYRNANIADDYIDYVRLGFALANGLGSDGHDLYHQICALSPKYNVADCEQKWKECLGKSDGRTSIATFYHMARQAGVDISAVAREVIRDFYY